MKMTDRALPAVALACAALSFNAAAAAPPATEEARLLAALHKAYPGTQFTRVARTPIPELYEVWMGANMALVSRKNLRYLVFGRVFDTRTMTDLTAPKLAQDQQNRDDSQQSAVPAIPIDQLPLADAIKTVHGDGSRAIAVFSDPACPYCKRLEPELDKLDNTTVYTFLVPFQGVALPIAIWCNADRQNAWHRYMVQGDQSVAAATSPQPASCSHPIERNLALAQRLQVRGTPTIFYADGSRTDGYVDAAEMASHAAAVAAHAPSPAAAPQEVLP